MAKSTSPGEINEVPVLSSCLRKGEFRHISSYRTAAARRAHRVAPKGVAGQSKYLSV